MKSVINKFYFASINPKKLRILPFSFQWLYIHIQPTVIWNNRKIYLAYIQTCIHFLSHIDWACVLTRNFSCGITSNLTAWTDRISQSKKRKLDLSYKFNFSYHYDPHLLNECIFPETKTTVVYFSCI